MGLGVVFFMVYVCGWLVGFGTGIFLTLDYINRVAKKQKEKDLREINIRALYPNKYQDDKK
jgi:hypothetical protein